jgi:RimJ/RimL family protein N-acetyltransferase
MTDVVLTTDRLLLRRWRPEDREPFASMNADPRVMEYFPHLLSREESDQLVERSEAHFRNHGFGPFALERRDSGEFLGFTGLYIPTFEAPFTPCVEIGWRLAAEFWGEGLATEAARAVVAYAFEVLGLEALVSFTVPANQRSRRVMEKLGMRRDPSEDFDHPGIADGDPLRRHVLYRLWKDNRPAALR